MASRIAEAVFRVFCVWGSRSSTTRNVGFATRVAPPLTPPVVVMTTQYVLRTDKKDKDGRRPVHLVVYFDGARLKCATGDKCKPTDWNADKQQFRRSFPFAEEANQYLARRVHEVGAWWRKLLAVGETPTLAGLRAVLRPAPVVAAAPVLQVSVTVRYAEYMAALRAGGMRGRRCGSMWWLVTGLRALRSTAAQCWTRLRMTLPDMMRY